MDTSWMAEGKCRELPPSTFFPSDGVGVDAARRICAECPVRRSCLEYALEHDLVHGIWGGTTPEDRQAWRRQRRRHARLRAGAWDAS